MKKISFLIPILILAVIYIIFKFYYLTNNNSNNNYNMKDSDQSVGEINICNRNYSFNNIYLNNKEISHQIIELLFNHKNLCEYASDMSNNIDIITDDQEKDLYIQINNINNTSHLLFIDKKSMELFYMNTYDASSLLIGKIK